MKKLFTAILVMVVIAIFILNTHLFTHQKDVYTIRGELKGASFKKIYLREIPLFYKDSHRLDSTVANKNGRFIFIGKVMDGASPYELKVDGQSESKSFILCNSKISVIGNKDSLSNTKILGSIEEDISKKLDSISFDKQFANLENAYDSAIVLNDTAELKKIKFQREALVKKRNDVYKKFIYTYPSAFVSAVLLGEIINSDMITDAEVLYDTIAAANKSNQLVLAFFKNLIETRKNVTIGKTAPDFTQLDILGNPVMLSQYKGNYVLLDFWASWCGPCRKENPNLVNLYTKYRNKKFIIISFSVDNNKKDWLNAVKKDNMTWINVSDLKGKHNLAKRLYGVMGIPDNFLIDPNGKIIATRLLGDNLNKKLEEIIK